MQEGESSMQWTGGSVFIWNGEIVATGLEKDKEEDES